MDAEVLFYVVVGLVFLPFTLLWVVQTVLVVVALPWWGPRAVREVAETATRVVERPEVLTRLVSPGVAHVLLGIVWLVAALFSYLLVASELQRRMGDADWAGAGIGLPLLAGTMLIGLMTAELSWRWYRRMLRARASGRGGR